MSSSPAAGSGIRYAVRFAYCGRAARVLGLSGVVSEPQMRALFGLGMHPDAVKIVARKLGDGDTSKQALRAARLGPAVRQLSELSPLDEEIEEVLQHAAEQLCRPLTKAETRHLRMWSAARVFEAEYHRPSSGCAPKASAAKNGTTSPTPSTCTPAPASNAAWNRCVSVPSLPASPSCHPPRPGTNHLHPAATGPTANVPRTAETGSRGLPRDCSRSRYARDEYFRYPPAGIRKGLEPQAASGTDFTAPSLTRGGRPAYGVGHPARGGAQYASDEHFESKCGRFKYSRDAYCALSGRKGRFPEFAEYSSHECFCQCLYVSDAKEQLGEHACGDSCARQICLLGACMPGAGPVAAEALTPKPMPPLLRCGECRSAGGGLAGVDVGE